MEMVMQLLERTFLKGYTSNNSSSRKSANCKKRSYEILKEFEETFLTFKIHELQSSFHGMLLAHSLTS